MRAISLPFKARALESGGRTVLLVDDTDDIVHLRFAFVERESGLEIFPESLLDDWGHEITSLDLYDWVLENGLQFPRAEIFGFDKDGEPTQCFLRELDLTTWYACYLYKGAGSPLSDGVLVEAIATIDSQVDHAQRIKRPDHISGPLRMAHVSWWRIPSDSENSFDFSLIIDP